MVPLTLVGPTFRMHARELSAARGRNRGRGSTVPPVTDNLTPGLNGLLAHNIGRPRQDTGHYNMEMTGTHRPPSIGHAEPRARPISVTLIRPASPCDKQGRGGDASYAATSIDGISLAGWNPFLFIDFQQFPPFWPNFFSSKSFRKIDT